MSLLAPTGARRRRARPVRKRSLSRRSTAIAVATCIAWIAGAPARADEPPAPAVPGASWERAAPGALGLDPELLARGRDFAQEGGGSGLVVRRGRVAFAWGPLDERYSLKSSTKSIGCTALGLALADGKLGLDDPARRHHPSLGVPPEENRESERRDEITVFHLATQTAGFEKPGGYTHLVFDPGTRWAYSDGGPNWLAEAITLLYGRDLHDLLFERVFGPIGLEEDDLVWRRNAYRPAEIEGVARREFGSGIRANVDAMARIGLLYLRGGVWDGERLLPRSFVDACRTTSRTVAGLPVVKEEEYDGASDHYGLLWWNNADGTLAGVPRDAYWSWGLYDSLIVVVPSLDLVIARAGKSLPREEEWSGHYDVLAPLLGPICRAARPFAGAPAPCPPSPVVRSLRWAPEGEIVRLAEGGDNWPAAWAEDGTLWTAWGDGWGFEPRTDEKLSLGVARVRGDPPGVSGENVRSPDIEARGGGRSGAKASGILAFDGEVWLWERNTGNARLAVSRDGGSTWTRPGVRFTESFGHPAFCDPGRGGRGGPVGRFAYIVSPDHDSAYEPARDMVLARAPRKRLGDPEAWRVYAGRGSDGRPRWSRDVSRRAPVFSAPPRGVYRPSVSWCAPLGRWLLCRPLPGGDTRFEGGLAIHDAPKLTGPWTTVWRTEPWDVGPGESLRFPTKWMGPEGETLWLLFSGDDAFSLREARLETWPPQPFPAREGAGSDGAGEGG